MSRLQVQPIIIFAVVLVACIGPSVHGAPLGSIQPVLPPELGGGVLPSYVTSPDSLSAFGGRVKDAFALTVPSKKADMETVSIYFEHEKPTDLEVNGGAAQVPVVLGAAGQAQLASLKTKVSAVQAQGGKIVLVAHASKPGDNAFNDALTKRRLDFLLALTGADAFLWNPVEANGEVIQPPSCQISKPGAFFCGETHASSDPNNSRRVDVFLLTPAKPQQDVFCDKFDFSSVQNQPWISIFMEFDIVKPGHEAVCVDTFPNVPSQALTPEKRNTDILSMRKLNQELLPLREQRETNGEAGALQFMETEGRWYSSSLKVQSFAAGTWVDAAMAMSAGASANSGTGVPAGAQGPPPGGPVVGGSQGGSHMTQPRGKASLHMQGGVGGMARDGLTESPAVQGRLTLAFKHTGTTWHSEVPAGSASTYALEEELPLELVRKLFWGGRTDAAPAWKAVCQCSDNVGKLLFLHKVAGLLNPRQLAEGGVTAEWRAMPRLQPLWAKSMPADVRNAAALAGASLKGNAAAIRARISEFSKCVLQTAGRLPNPPSASVNGILAPKEVPL